MTTHHFVILDTETGGLNWRKHSIIEIAAWAFHVENLGADRGLAFRYHSTAKYHQRCKPDRPVAPEAARLNGYTESAWARAPLLDVALHSFFAWLVEHAPEGAMWCGSNPMFDLQFLESDAERCGVPMPTHMSHRKIDVASLCLPLFIAGETEGIGLRHLRPWAALPGEQKHTAVADVEDTLVVFQKYLGRCVLGDFVPFRDGKRID